MLKKNRRFGSEGVPNIGICTKYSSFSRFANSTKPFACKDIKIALTEIMELTKTLDQAQEKVLLSCVFKTCINVNVNVFSENFHQKCEGEGEGEFHQSDWGGEEWVEAHTGPVCYFNLFITSMFLNQCFDFFLFLMEVPHLVQNFIHRQNVKTYPILTWYLRKKLCLAMTPSSMNMISPMSSHCEFEGMASTLSILTAQKTTVQKTG